VSFITGDFRNVTSDCCASGGRYALAGPCSWSSSPSP
jgi:hypothetical protein